VLANNLKLTKIDLITFCLAHPYQTVQSIHFIASTQPKSVSYFLKKFLNLIIYQAKLKKLKKGRANYIIFDEGLLHKLRQIRRSSKRTNLSYRDIKRSFREKFFSFPDIVVLVIPPLDILLKRCINRNSNIEKEKIIKNFKTVDGSIEKSIQITKDDVFSASKEYKFMVIEVSNGQDLPNLNTIDEIVEKILNLQ